MKRLFILIACMLLFMFTSSLAQEADDIIGEWYTAEGKSLVKIYKCNDLYCGKIIWLKEPKYDDGTDKIDKNNPDESKKTRKIIGLDIVYGFKHKDKNRWTHGKIYDPNNGKTYSCKIKLVDNELKLRGYIGISLIGRTTVWTKKS
ncbi:MAG: DUF2147 domain-containing protein [Desulfobacterales bacterium]|nr:DUF2147 domain-containing protein [Desulfobacterales bacterium]